MKSSKSPPFVHADFLEVLLVYADNRGSCRLHGSMCRLACAIASFIYSQTYIEKSSWGKPNIGCLTLLFSP